MMRTKPSVTFDKLAYDEMLINSYLHVLLRGEEGQLQVMPPAVLVRRARRGRLILVGPGVGVEGVLAEVEAGIFGGGLQRSEPLQRKSCNSVRIRKSR